MHLYQCSCDVFFLVCASVFIVYFLTVLQLLWTFDIKTLRNLCWLFLLSVGALPHQCHLCSCREWTVLEWNYPRSKLDRWCQAFHMDSFTPGLYKSSFAWLQFKKYFLKFPLCLKADLVLFPPLIGCLLQRSFNRCVEFRVSGEFHRTHPFIGLQQSQENLKSKQSSLNLT